MRHLFFSILLALPICGWAQKNQTLSIQTGLSGVTWTGYAELGSWAPSGSIQVQSGAITLENGQIKSGSVVFNMTSIRQEIAQLEEHLKGSDFFDTQTYPTARFSLTAVVNGVAVGQLTIKNTTREIQLPLSVSKTGNQYTVEGAAVVDRTAFGIRYNSGSFFGNLGDQAIKNEFKIDFKLVAK